MKCENCQNNIKAKSLICPKCANLPHDPGIWNTIDKTSTFLLKLTKEYLDKFSRRYTGNQLYVMENLATILLWTGLSLNKFRENYETPDSSMSELVIRKKFTNRKNMNKISHNLDLMNREASMALFMFQIENFLKQVNLMLENKFDGKGYGQLVKHVLKELHLNDSKQENYSSLYIPSAVRNTLHYAGIHTDNSYNGKIQKILFKFEKNKKTNYGSWNHTCFFFKNMIIMVETILSTPKIKNIDLPALEKSE